MSILICGGCQYSVLLIPSTQSVCVPHIGAFCGYVYFLNWIVIDSERICSKRKDFHHCVVSNLFLHKQAHSTKYMRLQEDRNIVSVSRVMCCCTNVHTCMTQTMLVNDGNLKKFPLPGGHTELRYQL